MSNLTYGGKYKMKQDKEEQQIEKIFQTELNYNPRIRSNPGNCTRFGVCY